MNRGIYAIICNTNGKMYIGYTFNFKTRKKTHWSKLNQNNYKGKNDQLQDDWNLYSKNSFKFVIIEVCNTDSINEMLQKEEDYIVRFGTFFEDKGYNISLPVSKIYRQTFIKEHGEDFLREIMQSNDELLLMSDWKSKRIDTSKKVYQINKNNEIIRVWKNRREVTNELNLSKNTSERFTLGSKKYGKRKGEVKTFKGFVWVLEDKYDPLFNYSDLFLRKKSTGRPKVNPPKVYKAIEDYNIKRKPISLQNIETGEIRNFKSLSDANRIMGFGNQAINNLLKGWKSKGGGKIAKITQWKGWKIYNS